MTSSANCASVQTVNSDTLVVDVYPLPKPEIILSNDTISTGNYSGDQYSYTWYFNGNPVSNTSYVKCHDNGNGAYYVVVKLNNCTVTSSTVNIKCSTGTEETSIENNFVIFPNPTDKMITIAGSDLLDNEYNIEIFNLLGMKLKEISISSNSHKLHTHLDFGANPNGIYYILIRSSNYHKLFKIQKF